MLPEIFVTWENQLLLFRRDKKMPFRYWERRAARIFAEKPSCKLEEGGWGGGGVLFHKSVNFNLY